MAEVYKVGVALALTSNHQQVLGALSQQLLGITPRVKELQDHFSRLGLAVGGAFAMITGGVILRGLENIIRKTADLSQELARIEMLGISARETARIREQAGQIASRTPGMTSRDALAVYGQTYSMLGGAEAEKLMEPLTRLKSAMTAVSGKTVTDEQLREVTRAADLLGRLNDPKTGQYDEARFKHFLNIVAKTYSSTHGQVGPHEWLMMGQMGSTAFMGQSDRGLATAAVMAQMMGAYRTGTAEMSLYQQFIGGKMQRSSAEELVALGILSPGDVKESGRGIAGRHLHAGHGPRLSTMGRTTGGSEGGQLNLLSPEGQRKLAEFLGDNPLEAAGRLKLQMEKEGITDPKEQLQHIFRAFGRNTTQRLMADIMRSMGQITGEIGRLETSADVDAILQIAHDKSIPYNLLELNAAWKEMLYTLSDRSTPFIIGWLHSFTNAIKGLNTTIGAHPTLFLALAGGLGAIGVFLIGAGGVALLAALGVSGTLVLGIGALGAALMLVPWKDTFDAIVAGLNRFMERMAALGKWLGITGVPTPDIGALPPSMTTPNAYGNWSEAQRLGAGMRPIAYHPGGDAGRLIGGGLHSGGGYKLMPGTDGSPRIPSLPSPGTNTGALTGGGTVGAGRVVSGMGGNRRGVASIVASNWRAAGMGEHGIAGILANVNEESRFNPTLRHPDQPKWGGEAHFAHGLYQEGGQEWLNYSAWLGKYHPGADWRDPSLQSAFAAENLKKNYPGVWRRMVGARSREDAAAAYASGYLKPAQQYLNSRLDKFAHGVPGVDAYTGGEDRALGLHGQALRDHFGHRGRHDPNHPSSAIPHPASREIHLNNTMNLDGEVIGRNTTKHLVRSFNSPAKSGRMPDFSATRPVSI